MAQETPLLIFDIDGTLVDSGRITIRTVREVVSRFAHLRLPSDREILGTFGLSEAEMWRRLMPEGSPQERRRGSALYDELIVQRLHEEKVLLPHAAEVLEELHSRGYRMTTASNCDAPYLNAVLDSQDIRRFFHNPLCLGLVGGTVKADILQVHLSGNPVPQAYMIGDRASDMEAAAAHGIPAVGCDFGFGGAEELRGASRIIHALPELLELFPDLG